MAPNQGDVTNNPNTNNKDALHLSGSLADNDDVFERVRKMPKWEVDEDIVISGIAGRFPESDTFDEFADNLYKNINMITLDDRRWPADLNDGEGSQSGKLKDIDKFDGSFFSTLTILGDAMDPQSRILLETCYETIVDAGVNPQKMRGSRTGVYVGINTVACAEGYPQDDYHDVRKREAALWVQGSSRALYANRISFLFDFIGPSTCIDTACSASMVALVNALQDMRCGACDQAIVATANLCPAPFSNHIYSMIGLLAEDGRCKVWDRKADGFVRSETIGCVLLQKKSVARRNYATVVHGKTNTDGFKNIGIFSPFWMRQRNLMIETYQEAGVDPHKIKFFEAHGTGTSVGDPQEAKAIAEAYCTNREEPLLVGAVKSNCGHSEGSSGLCSLAKALITFENKMIPANLNFEQARAEITCIVEGKVVPVVKNTPFDGDIIGVNSFGVGGVNAHTLLKCNEKELSPNAYIIADEIPRIINIAGRTEESVNFMFDYIENNPKKVTRDFLAILGETMKTISVKGSSGFPHRGFMIGRQKKLEDGTITHEYTKTQSLTGRNDKIWLVFSGMGSQWTGMAKSLMIFKPFSQSLSRAANVLKPYNIDLMKLLLGDDEKEIKKTVNSFVAITSMQVALYDLIKLLNFEVEGIVGHSFGEIACAYADGCLTLEQAVLTAYWRGKVVETSTLPKGMLAAVGYTWEDAKKKCPNGIVPACHNGSDSVTISGLHDEMKKYIEQLKQENIFVREVAGGDYPYHSPFMKAVENKLIQSLKSVINDPKERSSKWLSTSFPETEWNTEFSKYASAEYFAHNLVSPVLFNETMKELPKNAVCLEVAPHSLFDSIFKRCFTDYTYVGLINRNESDNLDYFLKSIGKLYTLGLNPDIENFYPKVEWPVARGTQSLGSLFKWDHDRVYFVKKYPEFHNFSTASDYVMRFSAQDVDSMFLKDHMVDGRALFPATGYIMLVWRRLAAMKGQPWTKTPFAMENVRLHRPTLIGDQEVKFVIRILEGSGEFIISESGNTVATGRIWIPEDDLELQDKLLNEEEPEGEDDEKMDEILTCKEIYKELRIRGYDYGPKFQGLVEARGDGKVGKCKWTGHFISFFDSVMHLALIALPIRALFVPVGFQSIRCDPNELFQAVYEAKKEYMKQKELENIEEIRQGEEEIDEVEPTEDKQGGIGYMSLVKTKKDNEVDKYNDAITRLNPEQRSEAELFGIQPMMITQGDESVTTEILSIAKIREGEDNRDIPAILPVVFDFNMRSIVTRGIEVKGFIPFNIPRRPVTKGLTLETFQFTPHNEDNAIDEHLKKEYTDYVQVCCSVASKFLQVVGKSDKLDLNGYKLAEDDLVNEYLKAPNEQQTLLKAYIELLSLKLDKNDNLVREKENNQLVAIDLNTAIDAAFGNPDHNIYNDFLNNHCNNERLFRPSVDFLIENIPDKNLKILEMNTTSGLLALNVIHMIRSSVIGIYNMDYFVATPKTTVVPENVKTAGVRMIDWDMESNEFIQGMAGLDMIIYRLSNDLLTSWNLASQVQDLSNSLKEGGFCALTYRTKMTPPELLANQLAPKYFSAQTVNPKAIENFVTEATKKHFTLVNTKTDNMLASVILLRKLKVVKEDDKKEKIEPNIVRIDSRKYEDWFEKVQQIMEKSKEDKENAATTWLIANDSPANGIIGLTKCLRQEPGGATMRCIFDYDSKLPQNIDFTKSPFKEIQQMDLSVNVYKDGKWGTYRHFKLSEQQETIESEHAYLNAVTRGDMSSLRWFDGQHKCWPTIPDDQKNSKEVLCNVYYSSLNFKDVVITSGKIQPGPESALFDCVIGMEFAGRRSDTGQKVMGMVPFKGIATTLMTYKDCLWEVPDEWSLEDAATVPVVYATAYYSLVTRGNLQEGEKVLIHSGAGGVGQASIFICQSYNCEIFVTVGSEEKRDFIKKKFGLDDEHIANSHDTTFERQIMKMTKGKGVDIVLNSLIEEKLQASVRCLGLNGRFLEIGKYDMQMNKNLGLFAFLNNITFHGVGLDCIFREGPNSKFIKKFMKEKIGRAHV